MARILTIIALLFVTPAWAESRAMKCFRFDENADESEQFSAVIKYSNNWIVDSCHYRQDGEWEIFEGFSARDWSCKSDDFENDELKYTEKFVYDFLALTMLVKTHEKRLFFDCEPVELPD